MEEVNTSEPTQADPIIVEVNQTDYTEQFIRLEELLTESNENYETIILHMEDIKTELRAGNELSSFLTGFGLFAIIVILCRYTYKFFRMFI